MKWVRYSVISYQQTSKKRNCDGSENSSDADIWAEALTVLGKAGFLNNISFESWIFYCLRSWHISKEISFFKTIEKHTGKIWMGNHEYVEVSEKLKLL